MSFFQALLTGGGSTNPSGQRLFGVVGDSNADGRGGTIPTVASDTLFLWNGSGFTEITTQSVANAGGGTYGSIWQQFATDYKSGTGRKTLLVNGGTGGSEVYPNGDNTNWYTSGDLYAPWKTSMLAALASAGLSKPTAIFVNLGINDIRSGTSIANITTGIQSLVSRLLADFPGVPILVIQVGRSETGGQSELFYDVRRAWRDAAEDNADVHICGNAANFIGVSGGYNVDNLHYSQATNDTLGTQLAQWFLNQSYTKWTRSILSCQFTNLSATRKGLIQTWVESQIAAGNYFDRLESFTPFATPDFRNCNIDFTFLGYNVDVGAAIVTNQALTLTNANNTFALGFTPSFYNSNAGTSDVITGFKMVTNTSGSGTARVLFGRNDGTNYMRMAQGTTLTNYMVNSLSSANTSTAESTYADNTLYSIATDGTNKYYIKNTTVNHSTTNTISAPVSANLRFNPDAPTTPGFVCTIAYFYAAKYAGFDLTSFYNESEYLIAHWND